MPVLAPVVGLAEGRHRIPAPHGHDGLGGVLASVRLPPRLLGPVAHVGLAVAVMADQVIVQLLVGRRARQDRSLSVLIHDATVPVSHERVERSSPG